MKAAHGRKKSYVDNKRRPLEFSIGDRVFLKVSPWTHMLFFFSFWIIIFYIKRGEIVGFFLLISCYIHKKKKSKIRVSKG
jgi:hypothetical protein